MNVAIFVTVGTSALYNEELAWTWPDRERTRLRGEVERYRDDALQKRESWEVLCNDLVRAHKSFWDSEETYIRNGDNLRQTSAELISTMSILGPSILGSRRADRVVFLASDTTEGELAAEVNAEVLMKLRGAKTPAGVPKDLEVMVRKIPRLERRFIQVSTAVFDIVMETRGSGSNEVLFNITGGFKGAVPSITELAINKGWELYYQHESCDFAIRWQDLKVQGATVQARESEAKGWKL